MTVSSTSTTNTIGSVHVTAPKKLKLKHTITMRKTKGKTYNLVNSPIINSDSSNDVDDVKAFNTNDKEKYSNCNVRTVSRSDRTDRSS